MFLKYFLYIFVNNKYSNAIVMNILCDKPKMIL